MEVNFSNFESTSTEIFKFIFGENDVCFFALLRRLPTCRTTSTCTTKRFYRYLNTCQNTTRHIEVNLEDLYARNSHLTDVARNGFGLDYTSCALWFKEF